MENPQEAALSSTPSNSKQGFFGKYKFTLISLVVIVLAAIPLVVLSKKSTPSTPPTTQQAVASPTPTVVPLTSSNADDKLNQEDQQLQTTLNNVDSDMQSVNQIDTTQDSTTGL